VLLQSKVTLIYGGGGRVGRGVARTITATDVNISAGAIVD
jgi:hypothetical protein